MHILLNHLRKYKFRLCYKKNGRKGKAMNNMLRSNQEIYNKSNVCLRHNPTPASWGPETWDPHGHALARRDLFRTRS